MADLLSELHIVICIFTFLFGICVGSFLNVCIFWIPANKSIIFPPSECPDCHTKLSPIDLIPVLGYILLKGKCRYCKKPISVQYPLVEFLTGTVWLLIYLRYGLSIETAALLFLYTLLIPVTFIDLKYMIIPNGLVLTGIIGGIALSVYHIFVSPFSLYQSSSWYAPFLGMVSASGILFAIAVIGFIIYKNDGAMGMGDVKLFIPIGMFLGWKLALLALFLAVILGGVTSIVLLILKIKERKSAIPFGPFIAVATYITGFYGNQIISWYFSLSNGF